MEGFYLSIPLRSEQSIGPPLQLSIELGFVLFVSLYPMTSPSPRILAE